MKRNQTPPDCLPSGWVALPKWQVLVALLITSTAVLANDGERKAVDTSGEVDPVANGHGDRFTMLRDDDDGHVDVSRWLLEKKGGFLPVPILISDPSVGGGGGLAAAFFRPQQDAASSDGVRSEVDPDIYVAALMRTSNGTEAYGVGASLHFKGDLWRYRGAFGKASVNLDFHTNGMAGSPSRTIGYNVEGSASLQQLLRRFKDGRIYAGITLIYMDMDVSFNSEIDDALIPPLERTSTSSGLGLTFQYDSRDNSFTPSSGVFAAIDGVAYAERIGSDTGFQSYRGRSFSYTPVGKKLVIASRLDLRVVNGDVPFYRLPYIELRGIRAARYQDRNVAVVEAETRWLLTPRWSLVGFAGIGRAWGRGSDLDDVPSRVAKGAGVRYLIARYLGLHVGPDYAWGPEDGTFYVQVGSAWR